MTSERSTHNVATAAVALYMPPGINVKYDVANGPTELGMAGLGVKVCLDIVWLPMMMNSKWTHF